jgi:hypothetical protein
MFNARSDLLFSLASSLALMAVAASGTAQSPAPAPSPSSPAPSQGPRPCTAPIHRHFDFWIGQWDVMGANGNFAGTNRIIAVDGGCALHESWSSGGGGYTGQSLNSVGLDGKWHQTWVDRSGLRLELTGGLVGSSMVLEGETLARGPQQPAALNRITWTPQSPNLVRQHWETSSDQGKTWASAFDGLYHRIPEATAPAPSFLTRLSGGWIGVGQLLERDSHVELRVEPILGRPLFALNWRNVVLSDPRSPFEGIAIYEDTGNGEFVATWWDSQGAKHPVKAGTTESSMTSAWGENGRTVYTLLANGELEVVDSTKRPDGAWDEFGRATLKRK